MISRHPNGSHVLFHIGTGRSNETAQVLHIALQEKSTVQPPDGQNPPIFKQCSNDSDPLSLSEGQPHPATTHISESLAGPWRPALGIPILNNPSPYFFENGSVLLYDRESVVVAPSLNGPWGSHRPTVLSNGTRQPEE